MSRVASNGRGPAGGGVAIEIAWRIRRDWRATPLMLRKAAVAALRAERLRRGTLSIAVVGRRAMAKLHASSMGVSGPTDVLTFDLGGDAGRGRVDGEIVVCADVALAEARRRAFGAARQGAGPRAATRELCLYVVHGVLHLAGYDDHAPADFARMHAREDAILRRAGIGSVFAEE